MSRPRATGLHPIHGSDDAACRFLALSAGRRTAQDEAEIAEALANLPYSHGPVPRLHFPIDPGNVWMLDKS